MIAASAPAETTLADPALDRTARHMARLEELAEIGMAIARALGRQAAAGSEEAGLAFTRVARAVRQTVALEERLETGFQARKAAAKAAEAERLAEEDWEAGNRSVRGSINRTLPRNCRCALASGLSPASIDALAAAFA